MLRFDDAEKVLELGVHDLIEAGPPRGDLRLQIAWSARARMKAGTEVHGVYQAARAAEDALFRREVTLRHRLIVRGWEVVISGRVDGLTEVDGQWIVEEVKSSTAPGPRLVGRVATDFPAWSRQVQLYLWFLAAQGRIAQGQLIVISVLDQTQVSIPVEADPDIAAWALRQLDYTLLQHEQTLAWQHQRRTGPLPFAWATFRPGQEELAARVEAELYRGHHSLLLAPTGYGKTAAVLFAALRVATALGKRVFYATARNTQAKMAEDSLRAMAARGLPIRAVTLRAREKVCLNEVVSCRPEACRFAADFHDKVRDHDLVAALWSEGGVPGVDAVVDKGEQFTVCPFALGLDLADNADVIIGDYNYVFDPAVRLTAFFERPEDWIVIVDEAHQLPDRARGYGSPELRLGLLEQAADLLNDHPESASLRPFTDLLDEVAELLRAGISTIPADARDGEIGESLAEGLDKAILLRLAAAAEGMALEWALRNSVSAVFPTGTPDLWLEAARALLRLRSAVERAGPETVVIWRRGGPAAPVGPQRSLFGRLPAGPADPVAGMALCCRDPSRLLAPLMGSLFATVMMSATLEPPDFYAAMAAIPEARLAVLRSPSPFDPARRKVLVVPSISTEFRHRDRDRSATARLIQEALSAVPGNAAVFFPSFAYLESIRPLLKGTARPLLVQDRGLDEAGRERLLATMRQGEGHVLLAVLGGVFSEGVDLPGSALLAAIIVGPALPAATLERRLLEAWFEERYQQGTRYAWQVPGMGRVLQAAGRVIRTETDRGAIVLLCRRFVQPELAGFFPADWNPERTTSPGLALAGFWGP